MSRSQPSKASKDKEEVTEQFPPEEIVEEEEEEQQDPEEEEEAPEEEEEDGVEEDELRKSAETQIPKSKSSPTNRNGFVSESDYESGSDDSHSGYKFQPIPKPTVSTPITSSTKRTNRPTSDNQRSKKKPKPNPKDKKSASGSANAARVWNKEDEIVVLSEMDDFKKLKGVDLNLELAAFFNSIKGKLQGDYSKEQLRTKIKHMKRKFLNMKLKCENGSDTAFSNSHDQFVFDLSKKVWGAAAKGKVTNGTGNGVHEDVAKENNIGCKKDSMEEENIVMEDEKEEGQGVERFWAKYPFLSASFDDSLKDHNSLGLSDATMRLVKENLNLIGIDKAKDLDDEWKELLLEEMELNYKRAALVRKQMKLVFNFINSYYVG